ncbi:MAG: 30S ribosomal protein S20 [Candidatus Gracilibacteria bacterium]|nr:30S ribosomal protein S20 [Candidatus Gracilibacteria bacterium]
MPVIKSAKKQMRQNMKRREQRLPIRNQMKTTYKKALKLLKEGKIAEAEKFLATAYKVIDTAAKKNIIHKNNANRKKSVLARGLNNLSAKKKASDSEPVAKKGK